MRLDQTFWIYKGKARRLNSCQLVMILEGLCKVSKAGHIKTVDTCHCLLLLTIQVFTNFLLPISWHKYVNILPQKAFILLSLGSGKDLKLHHRLPCLDLGGLNLWENSGASLRLCVGGGVWEWHMCACIIVNFDVGPVHVSTVTHFLRASVL